MTDAQGRPARTALAGGARGRLRCPRLVRGAAGGVLRARLALAAMLLASLAALACDAPRARADAAADASAAATPSASAPSPAGSAADLAASTAAGLAAQGWHVAAGERGVFEVAWRADGGAVPRNVECALDVLVRRDARPSADARLAVRGWMPDHGHGLVRAPIVTDLGDGRQRVEGLLLHMRGRWELFFDVTGDGVTDTVRFELTL